MRPPATAPRLTDGVVVLRPPDEGDLDAVVDQSRDPETVRWTSVPPDYQPHEAASFLGRLRAEASAGQRTSWAVERDGAFAGLLHLRREGEGVAEVSFATHPAYRGRGLTTRAVRLACAFAFSRGDEVVLWHAMVGNWASRRVAWACGFDITRGPVWRAAPPRRGGRAEQVWAGRLLPGEPMRPRHPWLTAPTVDADGVRLRPFRDSDGLRMPARHDPLAEAFAPGLPTRDRFPAWLLAQRTRAAEGSALSCAAADPMTDALLGGVDLSRLDVPILAGTALLGFWLLPEARGHGIAGRALDAFLPWAFGPAPEGLGLHAVSAGCAVANRASARVLRRAGFSPVGTERRLLQSGGEPTDSLLFDLLSGDDRQVTRVEPGRIPVLETRRFRLRAWREDDVPQAGEGPDEASRRFLPAGAHPDATTFPEWLRRRQLGQDEGRNLNWCIADRDSDHAVGNLTLFRLDPPPERFQAEVGYWLHPGARGRGVLRGTLPALVEHAFAPAAEGGLGLSRLYAATDVANLASQRILFAAGFRQWGEDRRAFRNGAGELTDGVHVELLADERADDRRARKRPLAEVSLDGQHVRLRPWRADDSTRIVEACTDPRTRHWLATLPEPYRAEEARAYVERCHRHAAAGSGLFLAVADRATDVCLGSVSVIGLDAGDGATGEVGYWTHPSARGRGVMTEAVRLLAAHAFRSSAEGGLGVRRLVLQAAVGNLASQHVAEALGFVRCGVERAALALGDGSWSDTVLYDLLASEPA